MARQGHRSKGRHKQRPRTTLEPVRSPERIALEQQRYSSMNHYALQAWEYWCKHVPDPLFVYFISEFGNTDAIKIGQAKNPLSRLLTLQTGNPRDLYVQALVLATEGLERSLHHRFKDYALRGEWFGNGMGYALLVLANGVMQDQVTRHKRGHDLAQVTGYGAMAMKFPADYTQEAA